MGGRIFISYRREDSADATYRLADALIERFGTEGVFVDIDTIAPGEDFGEVLSRAVASCDALVAVIGQRWVDSRDQDGRRRLDDPGDYVRAEIEAGLRRQIPVRA